MKINVNIFYLDSSMKTVKMLTDYTFKQTWNYVYDLLRKEKKINHAEIFVNGIKFDTMQMWKGKLLELRLKNSEKIFEGCNV